MQKAQLVFQFSISLACLMVAWPVLSGRYVAAPSCEAWKSADTARRGYAKPIAKAPGLRIRGPGLTALCCSKEPVRFAGEHFASLTNRPWVPAFLSKSHFGAKNLLIVLEMIFPVVQGLPLKLLPQ